MSVYSVGADAVGHIPRHRFFMRAWTTANCQLPNACQVTEIVQHGIQPLASSLTRTFADLGMTNLAGSSTECSSTDVMHDLFGEAALQRVKLCLHVRVMRGA